MCGIFSWSPQFSPLADVLAGEPPPPGDELIYPQIFQTNLIRSNIHCFTQRVPLENGVHSYSHSIKLRVTQIIKWNRPLIHEWYKPCITGNIDIFVPCMSLFLVHCGYINMSQDYAASPDKYNWLLLTFEPHLTRAVRFIDNYRFIDNFYLSLSELSISFSNSIVR